MVSPKLLGYIVADVVKDIGINSAILIRGSLITSKCSILLVELTIDKTELSTRNFFPSAALQWLYGCQQRQVNTVK